MASHSALPEPMLARSGPLPARGDFAFELKWDGFRALVSTERRLRVRSRRGWNMTEHVGFLADLPVRVLLDGELVALDAVGKPDFPTLCEAALLRRATAALTYIVFDLLSVIRTPIAAPIAKAHADRKRAQTQVTDATTDNSTAGDRP